MWIVERKFICGQRLKRALTEQDDRVLGAAIFVIAFLIRITVLLLDDGRLWKPLSAEAFRIAQNLAARGEYSDVFGAGTGPTAHTTPLYPLFMAGIFTVFGDGPTGYAAIRLFTCSAASLCYAMLPALAGRFGFSKAAGAMGGVVGAMLPYGRLESEGDFENVSATALFLVFIHFLGRACCRQERARVFGFTIGLAAGCLSLFGAALVPGVALGLLAEWRRDPLFRKMRILGVMCCGVLLALSPWALRNYVVFETFIPLRSNLWLEIAVSNQDGASPILEENIRSKLFHKVHPYSNEVERSLYRKIGETEYMVQKKKSALAWMANNRGYFVLLGVRRMWAVLFYRHWNVLLTLILWLVVAGGIFGAVIEVRSAEERANRGFLWGLIIALAIVHVVVQVSWRYRYPIHILMLIPCGNAVLFCLSSRSAREDDFSGANPAGLFRKESGAGDISMQSGGGSRY